MKRQPTSNIVEAEPEAPVDVFSDFCGLADEVVVPNTPEDFFAIGVFYERFAPVEDSEVTRALEGFERHVDV
jgi:putative phosphoribosyl transferase